MEPPFLIDGAPYLTAVYAPRNRGVQEAPGPVDVRVRRFLQQQCLPGGEHQVVEVPDPGEEAAHLVLVRHVEHLPLRSFRQPPQRAVHGRPPTRGDHHVRPLPRGGLRHREPDARRAADDHDPLSSQTHPLSPGAIP
jgi:hypothetical protein